MRLHMKISDLISSSCVKAFFVGDKAYTIGCHATDQGAVFVEGYHSPSDPFFFVTEDVELDNDPLVQVTPIERFIAKDYEVSVRFVVDFRL